MIVSSYLVLTVKHEGCHFGCNIFCNDSFGRGFIQTFPRLHILFLILPNITTISSTTRASRPRTDLWFLHCQWRQHLKIPSSISCSGDRLQSLPLSFDDSISSLSSMPLDMLWQHSCGHHIVVMICQLPHQQESTPSQLCWTHFSVTRLQPLSLLWPLDM